MTLWTRSRVVASLWLIALAGPSSNVLVAAADEYEYPELLVTPSASKRLETEAREESRSAWTNHVPTQGASAFVFIAGFLALDDPRLKDQEAGDTPMAKWAGIGAMASGAGWLTITGLLGATYRPYGSGWSGVKGLPTGSKRQMLERERAAEEALAAPARLGTRLTWLSVFFNLSMSTFVISSSEDNVTRVAGLLASIASTAPLIFESRWNRVYDTHLDYRKRIYGPVSGITPVRVPGTDRILPALSVSVLY